MDLRIRILEYMNKEQGKNIENPNFYINLLRLCYDLELNSFDAAAEIHKFKEEGCVRVFRDGFLLTEKGIRRLDRLKKIIDG